MSKSRADRIDYTPLSDLLTTEQWFQADLETARLLLEIGKRTNEGFLTSSDLDNIDCLDLFLLERLWKEASNGRFSWSTQLSIYQEYLHDLNALARRTGWQLNSPQTQIFLGISQRIQDKTLTISYPTAYFPYRYLDLFHGGEPMARIQLIHLFFTRLRSCQI